MSNDQNNHGAVLRGLRLACEPPMRQAALAERVKLSASAISQIEKGTRGISIDLLRRAAEVLACHLPMTSQQIILAIVTGEVDAPASIAVPCVDSDGASNE